MPTVSAAAAATDEEQQQQNLLFEAAKLLAKFSPVLSRTNLLAHLLNPKMLASRSGAAAIKAPGPKWTPGTLAEDVSFAGGTRFLSFACSHQ